MWDECTKNDIENQDSFEDVIDVLYMPENQFIQPNIYHFGHNF